MCPINMNLGIEDLAIIEGLESGFGSTHVYVLNKTIVETTVLVVIFI